MHCFKKFQSIHPETSLYIYILPCKTLLDRFLISYWVDGTHTSDAKCFLVISLAGARTSPLYSFLLKEAGLGAPWPERLINIISIFEVDNIINKKQYKPGKYTKYITFPFGTSITISSVCVLSQTVD